MEQNQKYKVRNKKLLDICKNTALKIGKNKVDQFEIYIASVLSNEIEIFDGKIETLSFSDSIGLGVRVFRNKAIGYAYTAVLEENRIDDCIKKAILNSRITKSEENNYLPEPEESIYKKKYIGNKDLYDPAFNDYSTKQKVDLAKRLEALTRDRDKRIASIDSVMYSDGISETAILNSSGFFDSFRSSVCFIYASAIARDNNDTSTGDFFGSGRNPGQLDLEEVAMQTARRSTAILGGKKIKSQKVDIILDPLVSAQFLGVIAAGLTADSVQKGKSLFREKIGEKIFSVDIDIFDDGILPAGLSSRPFDGEGVFKGKTAVFEKGRLKTFLHNTYTARKDKVLSTGNASRASYRSTPGVGLSNFYICPSKIPFDQLLSGMTKGFYVLDIIGLHSGANPVSGQMSVGAKGLWIENGTLSYPVKEVTIATDILTFCRSISKVADDLRFIPSGGYFGSPSILVEDITVSGK